MNVKSKYLIINTFSFFKRLMVFSPAVYNLLKYIPILLVLNRYISRNGLITSLILTVIILLSNGPLLLINYLPLFIFFIFKPQFSAIKFDNLVRKTKWLLIIAILYGFVQKLIGFFPFEKAWIYSGLSIVNEENIFIPNRSIRPFSIFASIPEFSIFCSIYFLYFLVNRNIWWIFISLFGLILSGSRGVIVALFVTTIITFFLKPKTYKLTIFYTLIITTLTYAGLILGSTYLTAISNTYSSNRILLYGTFNGRVENLLTRLSNFEIWNLVIPSSQNAFEIDNLTYDNLHANIFLNLGLFGYVVFMKNFRTAENNVLTSLYLALFISYGFFSDIIFSVYSMILFFVSIYGSKK